MAMRLAKGPTKAIGMAKWLTNRALDVDRATSFYDEAMGQELLSKTLDAQEGIASFLERRPAEFKGW
jgi:2-(1,2-epoxy-1,2-dihydrophenyl)acetyl-CoA isomerase